MAEEGKSTFVPFKQGDKVWLDTQNIKMNYHKKIRPKREGPFEILKVLGPVTYQLRLPSTWKIHPVFHTTLLRQYKETDVYGANFPWLPPDEKKCTKLNGFWNIENEDEGTNITWRGKDIPFWKHRGNQNRYFQTTETSWLTTNSTTIYEYPSSDYLTPFVIWEYEDGASVEVGWLFGPSQMSLEVLRMV